VAATAFVWKRGRQHYLITNWHVVTGRHAKTGELETVVQPDVLRAHFNTRIMDFGKKQIGISIRDDDNRPGWYPIRCGGAAVMSWLFPFRSPEMTQL
jgi:hypothetical protein